MSVIRTEISRPPAPGGFRDDSGGAGTDVLLAGGLAQLAVELYDVAGIEEAVGLVLAYARRTTTCDCAGVVLVDRRKGLKTGGATDRRVEQADQLQLEYGEGPCVPVSREQPSVLVSDTIVDPRWPRWSPRVAELGLRSVLTVRLCTARSNLGALSLYAIHPGRFTAIDETTARLLARHAAVAIATVLDASTLRQAIETATLIGQAQGVLMERFTIDADQAFAVLGRYSQDNNIKLRIVAAELISTRRLSTRSPVAAADRSPAIG
ncbi:GAF domain-containing protein [Kribbella sp. VKM Ac-2569]|uniref:GAF and ANTAR domain-containing protein n=1 Tax=Kribbella sp. VKM Ac-2569 TaxID=2512220 RepID=UPI00102C020B|nr:GAF and ANTAR domain-containing protein [Kribbella sp. VKM Ac-2569]RZT28022.1 GAF domain-containing protein [Kribbella sp. VKM Ac-2569]